MRLSAHAIASALPAPSRTVPVVALQGSIGLPDPGPGVANADLEPLLRTMTADARQMAPFITIARNRAAIDPEGVANATTFRQMHAEAVSRMLPDAARIFSSLAGLAESGELVRLLAGERTSSVSRSVCSGLYRAGKAAFDIGDSVLHKVDPERGRGIVVDYVTDGGQFVVQWDAFQQTEESAGDLVRTATVAPRRGPDPMDHLIEATRAVFERHPPTSERFRHLVSTVSPATEVQNIVRTALSRCGMRVPPEIFMIGFIPDPRPLEGAQTSGHARVIVRAKSAAGTNIEIEVPVPVIDDRPHTPDRFVYAGAPYALTEKSIHNLLNLYALSPIYRNVAPFQGPPQVMELPVPPLPGEFAVQPDLPMRMPGSGVYPAAHTP